MQHVARPLSWNHVVDRWRDDKTPREREKSDRWQESTSKSKIVERIGDMSLSIGGVNTHLSSRGFGG
jgi:hypothetical protein